MFTISKATIQDLGAVKQLASMYNKCTISEYLFNNHDIALQARDEEGTLVGFVWAGLMCKGKLCYVDKVTVHPDFSKKGILTALYKELFKIAQKRGVKEAFGVIRRDKYHNKSAKAALNMAWGADALPYTYVFAKVDHMKKELETHYGR